MSIQQFLRERLIGSHVNTLSVAVQLFGAESSRRVPPDAKNEHRREAIPVPMTTLDRLCADWSRLDLVKIDAEGAESLVWDGMQQTLKRFPRAVVLVELHLQRDPPQTTSFLHQLERSGYSIRFVNYDGQITATDAATILANPREHWMLWIHR
jgi:hypothetical protein